MQTFTVLDTERKPVACGEMVGDIFRVYMPQFEGGVREFSDLAELLEATGGYALQNELFPQPISTHQLNLFAETENETEQVVSEPDTQQINLFS